MDDIEAILQRAVGLSASGTAARQEGDESAAEDHYRKALGFAREAIRKTAESGTLALRLDVLRAGVCLALENGCVDEALTFLEQVYANDPMARYSDEWAPLRNVEAWPDGWLLAAVRRDPPDEAALDALAGRYWKSLFARCHVLTLDHHKAHDLAQEAWCRVLRARRALKPGGNFPGYLTTIATNIWRDWHRSARRAGAMAESRLASLDAIVEGVDGGTATLGDALPDLQELDAHQKQQLLADIDLALARLSPVLREVLVARFLAGETCAEIGHRHKRTEQTISSWVRQAVQEVRRQLEVVYGSAQRPTRT